MVSAYRGVAAESCAVRTELMNSHQKIRLVSEALSKDLFVVPWNPGLI